MRVASGRETRYRENRAEHNSNFDQSRTMNTSMIRRQPVYSRLAFVIVLTVVGLLTRSLVAAPTPPTDEELRKIPVVVLTTSEAERESMKPAEQTLK